jgi:hypothetical protein
MAAQPLLVHFLFHPRATSARELACALHKELNGDAAVPGLRIPTTFCPHAKDGGPPASFRFNLAARNFIVVLADDEMATDQEWGRFVTDVWTQCKEPDSRWVPFQLSQYAWGFDPRLSGVSFPPAWRSDEDAKLPYILRRLLVELCRFLYRLPMEGNESKAPVKLFLSHAKMDKKKQPVVDRFIDTLKADQPVKAWFDSGAIPPGAGFARKIQDGIKQSSVLSVLTDNYATREWCREEILLAKEHQRPIAVVNALSTFEARSFPYLGNVPVIRWNDDPEVGINLILKETVRSVHSMECLTRFQQPGDVLFSSPPEFATIAGLSAGTTVLYPDPPLGVGEARRLSKTKVVLNTPLQRLAADRPLTGKKIALSMSESTDVDQFGMDELHLGTAMGELSRYLLIKGATLAYGGHLGSDGYTQQLTEFVLAHNADDYGLEIDRIVNFRGWPLPRVDAAKRAEMRAVAQILELGRPPDVDASLSPEFIDNIKTFLDPTASAVNRFAWARGMTEMRAYQTDMKKSGVVARIVAGGKFGPTLGPALASMENAKERKKQWYAGRVPGVLEEVVLSIQAGQPVFLLGAFGGTARLVIDIFHGIDRKEATWQYQEDAPFALEMKELYRQRGVPWLDYPEMVALLRGKGVAGINPLLTPSEHEELFESVDPLRMAELVLVGLGKLPL